MFDAVLEDDHKLACQWYDRATDLLLSPDLVTTDALPQQLGDALISMGVSYWQTDRYDRAIELTEVGAEKLELAVESGLLHQESLLVPYKNLSAMYEAHGKEKSAARYEHLAKQVSENKLSRAPTSAQRR